MKKIKLFLAILLCLAATTTVEAQKTFYFQETASVIDGASDKGSVYVSFANTAPADDAYTTSMTTDVFCKNGSKSNSTNTSTTLYLYAKPAAGYRFIGWTTSAQAESLSSTEANYSLDVTSNNESAEAPAKSTYYAVFEANNKYQVRNGSFEMWAATNEPGYGWNSFPSAVGSMASTGKGMSPNPEKVEGRNGGSAVRIFSKYAGMTIPFVGKIGANANGNLTTGIVNMGSTTPASTSNYNFSKTEDPDHCLLIQGQPDGVEFYTKYKKGQDGDYKGHANFIIHDKYDYRDPEVDEELSHKIGECGIDINESEDWVRNYADFTYIWEKDAAEDADKYLLINFTTNKTPGGSINDELIIDDVRLIYNSEIATATYDGAAITFTDGKATVDSQYETSKTLNITSNGRAASIETDYDNEKATLKITVKGEDIEEDATNFHEYTISFAKPEATSIILKTVEDSDTTIYNLNGKQQSKLQQGINIVGGKKVIVK